MLATSGIQFSYPDGPRFDFPNLKASPNEPLLLLGQSGSGKTTLLHIIGGLRKAGQGEIHVADCDLQTLSGSALDKFRGQHIGIVFQTPHFVESITVLENLLLANSLAGKSSDKKRAEELLNRLGLSDRKSVKPKSLSIGEQQRASVARALMNKPAVVLADEPTSALDDLNTKTVIELLKEQASAEGAALVIVTHDQRLKDEFQNRVSL